MHRYIYAIWEPHTCFCYIDTKHYNLEQKLDLECRMRDGTSKLLAACKHHSQSLEAIKSLITSNHRIEAYSAESNRQKLLHQHLTQSESRIEASKAKVSISDIRMPLIWKDSDHFKNKGDYRRFSVFCMVKCGTEIYDTMLLNDVDRSMTDISFEDVLVLHNIPPDFELKLQVYSRMMSDDLSIASTPKKLRKKISSSVSRTFGRKMAAAVKEQLNEPVPKFQLVATATLRLEDADDSISTFDLKLEKTDSRSSQLPLFGLLCCRLAAQPYCMSEEVLCGYLLYDSGTSDKCLSKKSKSIFWTSLSNFTLNLWCKQSEFTSEDTDTDTDSDGEHKLACPDISIPIVGTTKIESGGDDKSFFISNGKDDEHFLKVLNKDDLSLWLSTLKNHCNDYVQWNHVAKRIMDIPEASSRAPDLLNQRLPGSLYEQISLIDGNCPLQQTSS